MIAVLYFASIICFGAATLDGATALELGILFLSVGSFGEYLKRLADGPANRVRMVLEDIGRDASWGQQHG